MIHSDKRLTLTKAFSILCFLRTLIYTQYFQHAMISWETFQSLHKLSII